MSCRAPFDPSIRLILVELRESRRGDSNPWPTLITSARSRVAGRRTGLQTPHN
jgi:hypothetical protein